MTFHRIVNDFRGSYIKPLFDPVQTHGLYGIFEDDLVKAEDILKKNGCNRFRVVKCRDSDFVILCFKVKTNP
jgi:hypothetical protein